MSRNRDIRKCALQALYQFDAGNADEPDIVRASLEGSPGSEDVHTHGFDLAMEAWEMHEQTDRAVTELAPQWPTYRQPVVDRSILRLAWMEMQTGRTPPKVAINEAVELAKEFSTEKSPMFINGILDKMLRGLKSEETQAMETQAEETQPGDSQSGSASATDTPADESTPAESGS